MDGREAPASPQCSLAAAALNAAVTFWPTVCILVASHIHTRANACGSVRGRVFDAVRAARYNSNFILKSHCL